MEDAMMASGFLPPIVRTTMPRAPETAQSALTVDEVKKWNADRIFQHLKETFPEDLDDEDLKILKTQKVRGRAFLGLTKEELMAGGMKLGPAKVIAEYVQELKANQTESSEPSPWQSFDVSVKPKTVEFLTWDTNINRATINELKERIATSYPLTEDIDSATIAIIVGDKKSIITEDSNLQTTLNVFSVSKIKNFTVSLEQLSRAFTSFSFAQVCHIYGISDDSDPSLSVIPRFDCGAALIDSNDPPLRHLIENLKSLKRATEFQLANEATRSLYVESFLVASVIHFENDIILRPQKLLRGKTGRGPVDFSLESRPTGVQVGVTEIKKDDLRKGIAQNAVQLEACLTARKRKREDEDVDLKKSYGIVTDARDWYFLRCEKGGDGRIQYSLSDPLIVELGKEVNSDHVKTVLERIIWLLGEMKKAEAEVEAELS